MGYIAHNAIIVTSWKQSSLDAAATAAISLGLTVLGPSDESTNGYKTIVVCPDGSKEGWDVSDEGDRARDAFKGYLRSVRYPNDGGSCLEWCEVRFGSDDENAVVVDHEWKKDEPQCS